LRKMHRRIEVGAAVFGSGEGIGRVIKSSGGGTGCLRVQFEAGGVVGPVQSGVGKGVCKINPLYVIRERRRGRTIVVGLTSRNEKTNRNEKERRFH
jgi:hypothetical protein